MIKIGRIGIYETRGIGTMLWLAWLDDSGRPDGEGGEFPAAEVNAIMERYEGLELATAIEKYYSERF